ncbi:MAG: DUF547 domain-containing protein [Thermoleophilia bacterium]|nr:DUF547 domain-containing protein [Thermoleophilia bacterium]MDH3724635.1 DUF547 domain-containing protein [Thermoleophilia bacterium]
MSPRRVAAPRFPAERGGSVDHAAFAGLLEASSDGWTVDYALVRASAEFRDYVAALATIDPDTLGRSEQLAYWINAYNANAMALAAEPEIDSILEIPGVFTDLRLEVGGARLTLDEIEHAKARRFGDLRVHLALNCASVGCPPLRVYHPARLDADLDENARCYLGDEARGARAEGDRLMLAMVFRWFAGDFAPVGQMPSLLGGVLGALFPRRVIPAAGPYLPAHLQRLRKVGFIKWDWRLNARP